MLLGAAFSSQGWRIVTGGADNSVRTYDCKLCGGVDQLLPIARARLARIKAADARP